MKKLSLMMIALLLGACGGSSRTDTSSLPPPPPVDPAPAPDPFFARVSAMAGNAPEDAQAADLGDTEGSAPEHTEPLAI